MAIVQSVSTPVGGESFLILPRAPDNNNTLHAFTSQLSVMHCSGVASSWTYEVIDDVHHATGVGPFTPNQQEQYKVTLTPGRTPPKIDATLEEVAS